MDNVSNNVLRRYLHRKLMFKNILLKVSHVNFSFIFYFKIESFLFLTIHYLRKLHKIGNLALCYFLLGK